MINLNDCVEIGFISKTHGVQGQLVVKLSHLSFDDIIEMELVFILIDGLPVPFFIEEFSERLPDSIILKLEDIHSEQEARKLTSYPVYTEKKFLTNIKSAEILHIDQFIGFSVIDKKSGKIGTLQSVIQNTNNPLLSIIDGKKEILIPLQEEFILDIDVDKNEILVDCPDGLLDMFE